MKGAEWEGEIEAFTQCQNWLCCNASWGRWTNELNLWASVKACALVPIHGFISPVYILTVLTSAWGLFTDVVIIVSPFSFHFIYPSHFHKSDSE